MAVMAVEHRTNPVQGINDRYEKALPNQKKVDKYILEQLGILTGAGWVLVDMADKVTLTRKEDDGSVTTCVFYAAPVGSIKHAALGLNLQAKGINSKRKGNENELACAKWFSRWTGYNFERVPSSGGLHWKGSVQTVGDLVCVTKGVDFAFTIETKHLKTLALPKKGKMLRVDSKIFKIWQQCVREGKAAKKIPLFFGRANRMPVNTWWVFMEKNVAIHVMLMAGINSYSYKGELNGINLYGFNSELFSRIDYNLLVKRLQNHD